MQQEIEECRGDQRAITHLLHCLIQYTATGYRGGHSHIHYWVDTDTQQKYTIMTLQLYIYSLLALCIHILTGIGGELEPGTQAI